MMNQDNPYAMNQTCKVCGEPAAGFHFGAFTCEGCKSFFGRSYNNLSSISDCKNNGECIINKKNRTACKACRLRKCLLVGMSKSGSRYGRRSNWFKIHCLLQEQQQQAAAAMAAAAQHHNSQQQGSGGVGGQHSGQHPVTGATMNSHHSAGGKPNMGPTGMGGFPGSAAAAAALGMLGHAGAYPGLYPRTKEELMMLGLEEYAAAAAASAAAASAKQHPAVGSPCVSSPDSHNSDSSVDIGTKNPLLHFAAAKHAASMDASAAAPPPPSQLRKDTSPALHHFLPGLPGFPGLGSMNVMPPPAFLPPSHLLFPGYHPALYAQHHQGLLKPSAEQQQAAAVAVQQLFNTTNQSTPAARYTPTMSTMAVPGQTSPQLGKTLAEEHQKRSSPSYMNNSSIAVEHLSPHITTNGDRQAAEELTKRFYLDAVLKSQRNASPPPSTTKLPPSTRSLHDHSISALVTPNSDNGSAADGSGGGRERRLSSQQSQEEDAEEATVDAEHVSVSADDDDDEDEDLVVSMTPPHSPAVSHVATAEEATPKMPTTPQPIQQDDPIDLSMKASGSGSLSVARSPLSSKESLNSNSSSMDAAGGESPEEHEEHENTSTVSESEERENGTRQAVRSSSESSEILEDEDDNSTMETVKTTIVNNNNNNSNSNNSCGGKNNNNNNNNNNGKNVAAELKQQHAKRKVEELLKLTQDLQDLQENQNREASKRLKLDFANMAANLGGTNVTTVNTTAAALDLTTKV